MKRASIQKYLAEIHQSSLQTKSQEVGMIKRFALKFHCCFNSFSISLKKSYRSVVYLTLTFLLPLVFSHIDFFVLFWNFRYLRLCLTFHDEVRTVLNTFNKERLPCFRFMSSSCTWNHLLPILVM